MRTGRMCYKGYCYMGYTADRYDGDDENGCPIILQVNEHTVRTPEGTEIHMDWSQWNDVSQEDFELWIDLGRPERISGCPLDRADLNAILISFEN